MILNTQQLALALNVSQSTAVLWVDLVNQYLPEYGIITPEEVASFLAQFGGHETNGLRRLTESFNYSVEGLANTWPTRFRDKKTLKPNPLACALGRTKTKPAQKELIANITYANRMGNGDFYSGDGYKYRGRGWSMLTGEYNYVRFSNHLGVDFVNHPDRVANDPKYALLSACWFWLENNLDEVDDDLSQLAETRIINGGLIGIRDRERRFSIAHKVLQEAYA